ncbi:MAG: hypothetical protein ACXADD_18735 [Candidatus Thorarchaeota archaeon]
MERHGKFVRLAMFVAMLIFAPVIVIGMVLFRTDNYVGLFIVIALSSSAFVVWVAWSLKKLFSQYDLERIDGR